MKDLELERAAALVAMPRIQASLIGPHEGLDQLLAIGPVLDYPVYPGGQTFRESLIEDLLKIRTRDGSIVPLRANDAQKEFSRCCGTRNIVLKARQLGITTYVAARFFIATITRPGTLTVQVAHDQRSAEEMFRIVHRFYENLPQVLREDALVTSRANVRQLVFPKLDSEYRVETAADREAGRGLTIQNLHCSEVARWPGDQAETLASLRAAVPPSGELVLESTPNGAGGVFYDEWMRAAETGTVRHFFPWWWEQAYRRDAEVGELTDEEQALVSEQGLSRAQIAFRREIRRSYRGLAAQEFAEDATSCFLTSGECVFDAEMIQQRLKEVAPPVATRDNGRELIYWPVRRGGEYVIGADTAGGGSEGDYCCAQVVDRATGLQCAELHGHFPPQEFASRLARLAHEYNDALLAVERNNHGHAVLAHLTTGASYSNLFRQREREGFETNVVSRPRMIERLAIVLTEQPELFGSRGLLEECRTFVRHPDGRAAGAAGTHDDRVMAMAIALEVRDASAGKRKTVQAAHFALATGA